MIRLRPFKLSDAPALLRWQGNQKSFVQWCANLFDYPLTLAQIETYARQYAEDEQAWIMTALDEAGTPIGHFMLRLADYAANSVRLGFVIMAPEVRGKGYGQEMVRQAVRYAFDIVQMQHITLTVFANHPIAHHCYLAVGFQEDQYRRDALYYENEVWGAYDMSIHRQLPSFV